MWHSLAFAHAVGGESGGTSGMIITSFMILVRTEQKPRLIVFGELDKLQQPD